MKNNQLYKLSLISLLISVPSITFAYEIYGNPNARYAQDIIKDSTSIGNDANCNNFIVAETTEHEFTCPQYQGNSYKGQQGIHYFVQNYIGLDKTISLELENFASVAQENNFIKQQCVFKGKQYAHFEPSTATTHQIFRPREKSWYANCYNSCNALTNLLKEVKEYEVKEECPNIKGLFFTKKMKKELTNVSSTLLSNIYPIEGKYYLNAQDCKSFSLKDIELSNNKNTSCVSTIDNSDGDSDYSNEDNFCVSKGETVNAYFLIDNSGSMYYGRLADKNPRYKVLKKFIERNFPLINDKVNIFIQKFDTNKVHKTYQVNKNDNINNILRDGFNFLSGYNALYHDWNEKMKEIKELSKSGKKSIIYVLTDGDLKYNGGGNDELDRKFNSLSYIGQLDLYNKVPEDLKLATVFINFNTQSDKFAVDLSKRNKSRSHLIKKEMNNDAHTLNAIINLKTCE